MKSLTQTSRELGISEASILRSIALLIEYGVVEEINIQPGITGFRVKPDKRALVELLIEDGPRRMN